MSRERERNLQNDLEALGSRLYKQEQVNVELSIKHDQLVSRLRQEQVAAILVCLLLLSGCYQAGLIFTFFFGGGGGGGGRKRCEREETISLKCCFVSSTSTSLACAMPTYFSGFWMLF